ncbi:MAG: DUF1553 domain-containing protein [Bryobacteraceae bacterium]
MLRSVLVLVAVCYLPLLDAQSLDFQRDVRPILSDACFHCHGPDQSTRMAGLRLDTREGAFSARKNGAPVVPGDARKSLLYARISESEPARRMPPPSSHKELTNEQRETLRRWIEQGAPWSEHWAFGPPVRPPLPDVRRSEWVRNPIDRFILARLEAAGLQPAPEADRRTLARRLSLDLTGLPPSPGEVEAFVQDASADAYEKLVDRLIASPHYGEHRARYWLDAARYADTHGLHIDNYREMWPYRDWVIQAFNSNMPFDRFTIEQLAGDLLPNPTLEQRIATGFHRCNVTTNEGGVIEEEVEAIYAKDRVDTTGTVWLGLTLGCASCHDHKFDPILQRDFYSMAAFFRNTTQKALDGNIPDTPPILLVPRPEDRERWFALAGEETGMRRQLASLREAAKDEFSGWLQSGEYRSARNPIGAESQILSLSIDDGVEAHYRGRPVRLDLPENVSVGEGDIQGGKALRFGEKGWVELPNLDQFDSDKPFSIAVLFYLPEAEDNFVIASQSTTGEKSRGLSIEIGARIPSLRLNADDGKGIRIRSSNIERLKPGAWRHIVFTYDGSGEQTGLGMFIDGRAIAAEGRGDQTTELTGRVWTPEPLRLARLGNRYLNEGAIGDFRVFDRVVTEEEARLIATWTRIEQARRKSNEQLTEEERDALGLYYANRVDPEYRRLAGKLSKLQEERLAIRRRGAITHVMEERKDSTPAAHILYRGQYDQPREKVEADVPSALPRMSDDLPRNRLGLAKWLLAPSNPLTARVTVNRFWQEVFGTGLVKSAEDFGSQGETPSHPDLLDWLAVEFRESGWDMKRMIRLMVTSSAYRQSARADEEKLKKDPDNRLLSRGPRFRLDGELIRDYALAASGLLSTKIGGPSVKPYQPDGIWETVAMLGSNTRFYKQDKGDRLYRRSLYTFWKRSAPPASMDILNAPSRENCTVRRERTNTPLQALVTMNDPQFVEASRHLAERAMLAAPGDVDRQIDLIAAYLLARPFDAPEREVVRRSYQDFISYYDSHPDDARKLISIGESERNPALNAAELAAMTMVASQVLNLDEALNK